MVGIGARFKIFVVESKIAAGFRRALPTLSGSLAIALACLFCAASFGWDVAITVDDIPAGGPNSPTNHRPSDMKIMLKAFADHKVTAYGFLNGMLVENMQEREQIMKSWTRAGHLVGNHTYSHLDLGHVEAQKYIYDIRKNESLLLDYVDSLKELRVFRYPYLSEGDSSEKRYVVRGFLKKRNYQIAQVTVDFEDWAYNEAYLRCREKKDSNSMNQIKSMYLEMAKKKWNEAIEQSKYIFGAQTQKPQILLLHFTPLTAEMIGTYLGWLKSQGAKFKDPMKIITDSTFQEDTSFVKKEGHTYWEQMIFSRKLDLKKVPLSEVPRSMIARFCK